VTEPIGGPLTLRRTVINDYSPPDDYEVMSDGRAIGRIYRPHAGAPRDRPWEWTITTLILAPASPSYGFTATREEAKAAFAATWREWLRLHQGAE
jgi:hypothetical protein